MYFVDRGQIERTLLYMEGLMQELTSQEFNSQVEKFGFERMIHMTIESMLDVGNLMIDGFIMRDPGSFDDIIDILVDERVIPDDQSDNFKEIIALRKILVKEYLSINHQVLMDTIRKNQATLEEFSSHIRVYLDNEMGVANTFSN
ncbi:DUF86 domain-containing protein [Aquibacillus koreensis]|uniref:DUF86 domain-containing protein n=1 Tax=Aquibacillus koreensis TaxID=279446 RepID=A0A9X3WKM7_9BACI|nr:DUF86 domain-containing protein [Aquibacillus koreensis]MCT2535907.1 DUF86 domain-containing protein [Aquibacillus koreensis]MDC3420363.1 DUF86 domain-containing protein [Aquibacillus koreensis]